MGTSVKAEKLHENEKILQAIDKCICSRDEQYERNKRVLEEILEDFFTAVRVGHSWFGRLFGGFFFVENYYKGLKVGKTEEFDVNIIMIFPMNYKLLEISEMKPGYTQLKLSYDPPPDRLPGDKYSFALSIWLEKDPSGKFSYFIKDAFRRSVEHLLRFSRRQECNSYPNYRLKHSGKYLAHMRPEDPSTLCVVKEGFPEMIVRLVPVLSLPGRPWHPTMEDLTWYAVPEILPNRTEVRPCRNENDHHRLWRMAFYNHEDNVLNTHSYIKPVIRLIEKLRDTQEWKAISCYHIKTLFMHIAVKIDDGECVNIWNEARIRIFIHILRKLRKVCKSRDLKNCWNPAHNLIDADESQLMDIVEQLTVIIEEIKDDPAKLAKWVLTPEEMGMYRNELKAIRNVENTGAGSYKDMLDRDDEVPMLVPGASAAAGGIESSPSYEAGRDIAGYHEELFRAIGTLGDVIKTLSRLSIALEQKSAPTA